MPSPGIWTLHWGALVLSLDRTRQVFRSNNALGFVTGFITGAIFLYRGRNYRPEIWGDDELLVDHAIHRTAPLGRLHIIDPFGLLDPFSGYLVVLLRISTKLLVLGGTETFAHRAFWFTSFVWTLVAILIALMIGRFTSRCLGFFAALTIAILPFSNLVMMAQVNAIHMPVVLALVIAVVTRQYPRSKVLQVVVCVTFALVTLTSVTTIAAFGYLLWLVLNPSKQLQTFERTLVWVMGGSLILQLLSYQPRGRVLTPSKFFHEVFLSSNAFAPQFIREKILEPKTAIENVLLYGIPLILGITVFILVRMGRQSELRAQVIVAQTFFLLASLLICLLIAGNGWLNSHYLFIPTGLFWIGVLLTSDAVRQSKFRFRFVPITVVLFIFLSQLSGVYFVI